MKLFSELFQNLDRTNSTNEKVKLLKEYFSVAPDADKLWALALFTGRRLPGTINSTKIQQWAAEVAGIPFWLFRESYSSVGDLGETISLLVYDSSSSSSSSSSSGKIDEAGESNRHPSPAFVPEEEHLVPQKSLAEWFAYFRLINEVNEPQKKKLIIAAWKQLSQYEIFVFNKLLMGNFRIGVSQTLVVRAIAEASNIDVNVTAHRVMGKWNAEDTTFHDLIFSENSKDTLSRPYPFYLANPVEPDFFETENAVEWFAEWKWDGIRAQVIIRGSDIYIWSRGEDLVTDKFPELHILKALMPNGTVLDGELVCMDCRMPGVRPMPFNTLQTRIGRKNLSKKILSDAPVAFIVYDILEFNGNDIRTSQQQERRKLLEEITENTGALSVIKLSPLINFSSWDDLKRLHIQSRENSAEGFMLKRKTAPYLVGRKKGDWWKWKVDPLNIDAVMVYAQKGSGRRAELFTDYTFAVWQGDLLVPFAKAYSGLNDAEIMEVDRFVRRNTLEKFGPVRTVKPELVFEIGFEGIQLSTRHKSGIAVRFPRILRWRKDKTASEANTLDDLIKMLEVFR